MHASVHVARNVTYRYSRKLKNNVLYSHNFLKRYIIELPSAPHKLQLKIL